MVNGDINIDIERETRIGFDEAILCEGKSLQQINIILDKFSDRNLLLTRLDSEIFEQLPQSSKNNLDYEQMSRTGILGEVNIPKGIPRIAILTAGTSDLSISREASRTLSYYGFSSIEIPDVGVAGLWRLMDRIEEIKKYQIVITIAGMDAALPSVVGGLVPGLVIAVPTSTGYGISCGGETALRSSLVSCAPGVVVVNIDNGYGAACAAIRTLNWSNISDQSES